MSYAVILRSDKACVAASIASLLGRCSGAGVYIDVGQCQDVAVFDRYRSPAEMFCHVRCSHDPRRNVHSSCTVALGAGARMWNNNVLSRGRPGVIVSRKIPVIADFDTSQWHLAKRLFFSFTFLARLFLAKSKSVYVQRCP